MGGSSPAGVRASVTTERTSRKPEPSGAGYLCFQPDPRRGDWAALLVVSPTGLPVEFLYSGPLRPTPVQSILYQDRLGLEVRLSLVRSLLRGLRSRPAFVALPREDWGPELGEELSHYPLLCLSEGEGEGDWLATPAPGAEAVRRHLEQVLGVGEPLGRARAALAYVAEYEHTRPDTAAEER